MKNGLHKHYGKYKINVIDTKTKEIIRSDEVKNTITTVALNELAKSFSTSSNMEIKYFAVGTSTASVSISDITLSSESFRCEKISNTISGSTNETTFVILDTEALVHIQEVGIFCGSSATGTANTGIMLSRILWELDKTSNIELQISRVDTITS